MRNRLRHDAITIFLTLGLIAGGGIALAAVGSDTSGDTATACPTETVTPTAAPDVTTADATDPTGEDQQGDDEQGDDEQSCDDDQGEDVSGDETDATETPAPAADTNPDRATECNTAAGVDPTAPPADPTVPLTGLDNAMAHVLANCVKNPDAPGLPNALAHLLANAERKALHDAAKAAGVHGHSGEVHGNSANAPGHSGEHGNPHS